MKTIDLDLLRQVTADALRVYEAVRRSEQLENEAQRAIASADVLLRETTQAFLGDEVTIVDSRGQTDRSAREAMIAEYIEVQKAYAQLKDALYRLMEARLANQEWEEAYLALRALERVDADYRDCALLKPGLELARRVASYLRTGQLAQAIEKAVAYLQTGGDDPRFNVLVGEVARRAVEHEAWDGMLEIVKALDAHKIDIRQWLGDHQIPFVEIRTLDWWRKSERWDIFFPHWLTKPFLGVVQKGKAVMHYYEDFYRLSIDFPYPGVFIKFKLPEMWPDQALSNTELVFGLLICRKERQTQ
jgi:hypothetical protein